jgi:cysteine desulfurase
MAEFRRVYLDNSATTPVAPEVLDAMLPYLTDRFGNASSIHFFGQEAKAAVDRARHQIASLINSRPNEVTFTSGGTEANNLAIRGLAQANPVGRHIITSVIEHSAVQAPCQDLEKQGYEVTYLPVYENGVVRVEDVRTALREDTFLISIIMANNEICTLQPFEEIGRWVRELRAEGRKLWFHTDAVQAAGKVNIDVEEIGCDLLSISAHKIYAPKGVGCLYVRRGVRLHPQNLGGHQERERRGGTEAVPNVVAFGAAAELVKRDLENSSVTLAALRDRLESSVCEIVPRTTVNGDRDRRIPTVSNISFDGIEGEGLLINLDMQGVAVSTGAACSSGTIEPSPIIKALGASDERSRGAIRFSFGRFNSSEDVERVLEVLPRAVEGLRSLAPATRPPSA